MVNTCPTCGKNRDGDVCRWCEWRNKTVTTPTVQSVSLPNARILDKPVLEETQALASLRADRAGMEAAAQRVLARPTGKDVSGQEAHALARMVEALLEVL